MPTIQKTDLPKSQVKLEFEVGYEEVRPYLEEAAREMSTARPLPGFRPGKAGFDEVKRAYGEMKILEGALERIIRAFYAKAILNESLDIVGSPNVQVDQLAPEQPLKFTITAPIEPKVTELPDLTGCVVEQTVKEIGDKELGEALEEMRKMRRQEVRVEREATLEDLVVVDVSMLKDGVVVEGGTGRDYRIYMNEPHYIPGFSEKLVGIKAGEERNFTLPFPSEHYQKHLAGKDIDFTTKATGVFEMQLPPLDDAFAQGVGLKDMEELKAKLQENLRVEEKRRREEASEIELLEKLVDTTKFTEVPEALITDETRRMMDELQHGVEEQGMKWEDYLSSIKKTRDELRLDMTAQAIRRVKTAVLVKAFAKAQAVTVTEEELDKETDEILSRIRENDQETRERVTSPEYRQYIAIQLRNRKTLEWLKKECVKEKK
jgi:trigger factor